MRLDGRGGQTAGEEHLYCPESIPWHLQGASDRFSPALRESVADPLGPYPETAVEALSDLGLTDGEIARYFRVETSRIRRVRNGEESDAGRARLREIARLVRSKLLG